MIAGAAYALFGSIKTSSPAMIGIYLVLVAQVILAIFKKEPAQNAPQSDA